MEKQLKKIPKTSELMWVLGTVLMSLGVCITKKADLGVSMIAAPTFILQEFLAPLSSFFSVGVTEYLLQGIILIILILVVRRFDWRFLLCFAAAVVYGYCLDFWLLVLGSEPFSSVAVRWIMLFVGDATVALSVACFFRTYFPLQIHELFVSEVSAKFSAAVPKVKWIYDLSCLALSVILAFTLFGDVKTFDFSLIYKTSFHSIGLATVITTVINAPIIKFWGFVLGKLTDNTPLIPKLENVLARKSQKKTVIDVDEDKFFVGVSGHRNIPKEDEPALISAVKEVLREAKGEAGDRKVIMLNGMARGGDVLCLTAAKEEGIEVHALLPCEESRYAESFEISEREAFWRNLSEAKEVIIAGDRELCRESFDGAVEDYEYRQQGIALAEQSDLLIVLWDGKAPKGKNGCGTAEVVRFALLNEYKGAKEGACAPKTVWINVRREGAEYDGEYNAFAKVIEASDLNINIGG